MKVGRIAAFLLVLYVAICVSFVLHIHLTEQPGGHCSICQFWDTPAAALSSIQYVPLLNIQEFCTPVVESAGRFEWASLESDRAPPRF